MLRCRIAGGRRGYLMKRRGDAYYSDLHMKVKTAVPIVLISKIWAREKVFVEFARISVNY